MIRLKEHRILTQILLWGGGWVFISFFLVNGHGNLERFAFRSASSFIGILIIILINMQYLLPKFYFQKKHVHFVVGSFLLIIATTLFLYNDFIPWADWFKHRNSQDFLIKPNGKLRKASMGFKWLGIIMPFIIAFLGNTLMEVARFASRKEKEAIQSEKEKLATELKFLKSQVNPHFLFNALNNIYSLAVMQAPQTSESVMQLSEILRYMVYDANEKKLPLKNEIKYIENFVELKLLKDSRGMDVQLDLDKSNTDIMVAPLLFIPFVENAFKHSKIENLKEGFIKIKLKTSPQAIEFHIENSIPKNGFTKDKVGGVGLENVKKRLELLYPNNQHELNIQQTDDQFHVYLKLKIV